MANIRVDLDYTLQDGAEIKFRSPVDCSQITGLIVYYPVADGNTVSKVFTLSDAHGNNVGDIDHLFAEDVVVKVILDVTKGMAFVQNADTNAYLEAQLASKRPNTWTPTATEVGAVPTGRKVNGKALSSDISLSASDVGAVPTSRTVNGKALSGNISLSASDVGARPNTWTPTAANVGAAPATADTTYTSCYYRTVNGVKEWINPPMVVNTEYRTTMRRRGKVVYAKLVDFSTLPANTTSSISLGIGGTQICSVKASTYSNSNGEYQPFPMGMNGTMAAYYWIDNSGKLSVRTMENLSSYYAVFEILYTKD